jgi:hypothetical protein
MKKETTILEYAILAIVIILVAAVIFHIKTQDVEFCRSVFTGLVKGKYSIQKHIDWDNFKALNTDIGATYSKFKTEKEKTDYRKGFIYSFKLGFEYSRGNLKEFNKWRAYRKEDGKTIVAVDYRKKTLLLTIPSSGKRVLTELAWKPQNVQ